MRFFYKEDIIEPIEEIKLEQIQVDKVDAINKSEVKPLTCTRCLGEKNYKGKICLQCGGEGVLHGALFDGISSLIKS
jgi:DnaJ-class molecular chaperone